VVVILVAGLRRTGVEPPPSEGFAFGERCTVFFLNLPVRKKYGYHWEFVTVQEAKD
jgi:hypothetical protein